MNRFFTLLFAASCLTAVGQYEVGDVGPAGGWIFYVDSLDEFDWDYLEVASFSGQAPNWGGYFQCSDNIEQSFEVGRGEWNTAYCLGEASPSIIAYLGTGSPGALVEAVGHTQGGYADWYLPSVGELELLYSAFGDSIADMIDISDYCSPGLRFWTSSFTVTDVYVNSCQHRGVTITLGGGTSSQETTGNQWGSGCGKVHGVLPIRSFSKSIQDACGVGTVWDELTQTCVVANPSDSNFDGCVQLNDLLDLLSAYGDCGAEESAWQCGDPLEYQGYDYQTVQIGEQCWFAENLRSENYQNGDSIPAGLSDISWGSTTSGAVAVYGEGSSGCYNDSPDGDACDEAWSLNEYGRFYNWYAVDDSRGLCPSGWHVPTDGEWTVMTNELGGGTIAGGKMKTDYGWSNGTNGTNSSGFSGLPGGLVGLDDYEYSFYFTGAGIIGYWWSSSPDSALAWCRELRAGGGDFVYRAAEDKSIGLSVRCVRDAE